MYGRLIRFNTIKNAQQSTNRLGVIYPSNSNSFYSASNQPTKKKSNIIDDIRESASGLPQVSTSSSPPDDDVNILKTSTSPSSIRGRGANLIDDIRASASGLPQTTSSWSAGGDDGVHVAKTSTFPSSSMSDRGCNGGDHVGSYVSDSAKQGVAKAMETGLEIGEMAKKTLDNVWDVTKDTTHMVKEAVAGGKEEGNDVPAKDRFVDDLRKRADGYDLRNK